MNELNNYELPSKKAIVIAATAFISACNGSNGDHGKNIMHDVDTVNQQTHLGPILEEQNTIQQDTVLVNNTPTTEIGGLACKIDTTGGFEDGVKLCLNFQYAEVEIIDVNTGNELGKGRTDKNGSIDIDISNPSWSLLNSDSPILIKAIGGTEGNGSIRVDKLGTTYSEYNNQYVIVRKAIIDKIGVILSRNDFDQALKNGEEIYTGKPQIAFAREVMDEGLIGVSDAFEPVSNWVLDEMNIHDTNGDNKVDFKDVLWTNSNSIADTAVSYTNQDLLFNSNTIKPEDIYIIPVPVISGVQLTFGREYDENGPHKTGEYSTDGCVTWNQFTTPNNATIAHLENGSSIHTRFDENNSNIKEHTVKY